MKSQSHAKGGFTLIELLTVIAIVAILSAILVPTVGQFRTLAKKTSDANDLRSIVQATQMLAAQQGENFVGPNDQLQPNGSVVEGEANDLKMVASILAVTAGLNDPNVWVSDNEKGTIPGSIVTRSEVDGVTTYTPNASITSDSFSFDYVTGLATFEPSTTPLAFSRKKTPSSSQWEDGDVYGASGGHIAFIGGNVSWYESLANKLVDPDGVVANNINDAIPTGAVIRDSQPPAAP